MKVWWVTLDGRSSVNLCFMFHPYLEMLTAIILLLVLTQFLFKAQTVFKSSIIAPCALHKCDDHFGLDSWYYTICWNCYCINIYNIIYLLSNVIYPTYFLSPGCTWFYYSLISYKFIWLYEAVSNIYAYWWKPAYFALLHIEWSCLAILHLIV